MIEGISELTKSYECKDCGALHTIKKTADVSSLTCSCGSKNLVYVSAEYTEEEMEKARKIFSEKFLEVKKILDYYMDIPEKTNTVLSLWICGTYLHDSFTTYPFLFINAMRGSGKTRLLNLISHLAKGGTGKVLRGLTESVFFRTKKGEVMVLDEMESIGNKGKSELREYLNASYKKGGIVKRMKKVKKKEGETYEEEIFEPFKPIAMANISGIEEVLGDRCINIVLQKSNDPSKTKIIEDFDNNVIILDIKQAFQCIECSLCSNVVVKQYTKKWNNYINQLYSYTTTYTTYTTQTTQTTPQTTTTTTTSKDIIDEELFLKINNSEIQGRNLELFFPLLITSSMIGEGCFNEALQIFKESSESRTLDELSESRDVSLINFVSQ